MKFAQTAVRAALLSTISIASIGFASAAQAQDETVEATDPVAAEEDVAFDEIIVTATRRDQAAQDVPLAVSVVAGEQLANAGIVDIRGIQQLAPSLKTTTGQSSATGAVRTIRGIGTAGDNPGF